MIDGILSGLFRSTVAVSLAAIAAWLLLTLLRPKSARLHQFVWLFALLQAACWQPFGLAILKPEPVAAIVDAPNLHLVSRSDFNEETAILPDQGAVIPALIPTPLPPAAYVAPQQHWPWASILVGIWFVGTCALLMRGLIDYLRLRQRLRAESATAPASWATDWNGLPHRGVELVATESLGPMLIQGFGRAVVAVPREFGDSLKPSERRAVFGHEINHHRGFDPFLMLIAWLATSAQWFNPFAWLASRRFHAAAELACDARLDDEARLPLANVLLSLGQAHRPAALAMTGGTLASRIRALAQPQPTNEPRWKSALLATLIAACALGGWIRLEARPATEQEPKVKSKEKTELPADAKSPAQDKVVPRKKPAAKRKGGEAYQKAPDEPLPQAIRKADEKLKRLEVERKEVRAIASKAAAEWTSLKAANSGATQEAINASEKRIDEAQAAYAKKAVELEQLKRNTEAMRDDLKQQQKKYELLWIRNLRQASPEDNDDALFLEKALGYLAAREPKFGGMEMLPFEEQPETEAVLKLEALLKRSALRPNFGETQREALERVLKSPPTEARKKWAEIRQNMKTLETPVAQWEDRRDYWLLMTAGLFESVAKKTPHDVWPKRMSEAQTPETAKHRFLCQYFYHAAIRNLPGVGGLRGWGQRGEVEKETLSTMLWQLLMAETLIKGAASDSKTWYDLKNAFNNPVRDKYSRDERGREFVVQRLFALLAAANANAAEKANSANFRVFLDDHLPGAGLDRLMELEGTGPNERARYFMERKTFVKFQGRGFANAFEELREKSAAPLVVLAPEWKSNFRPITLDANGQWIDIVREICRQAGLKAMPGYRLVTVFDSNSETYAARLMNASMRSRSRSLSKEMQAKLEVPTFLDATETPMIQALRFLSIQSSVPMVLLPSKDFDGQSPVTLDLQRVPLAVVLESLVMGVLHVWHPLEDSIVVGNQDNAAELEKNVAEFRNNYKKIKTLADGGDADAKRLMQKTFMDFSGTPLSQGLQFLATQHSGGKFESNVKDKDMPVSVNLSGVSLIEGLHLLAWSNGLKVTVDGTKVVLADK